MPVTTGPRGPLAGPRPDETLEGLLPSRRRSSTAVAVLAVLVLLLAWFSPQLLRPSVWDGTGGGAVTSFTTADPQLLTATVTDTESWLPFTVEDVEDVPGAHVLGAWLVTGSRAEAAEQGVVGPTSSAESYLAEVVPTADEARLPRRVASGGHTALLVLWAVDDCEALEQDAEPVVRLRNVIGATVTDTLPSFAAPGPDLLAAPEALGTSLCTR